jgi:transposase
MKKARRACINGADVTQICSSPPPQKRVKAAPSSPKQNTEDLTTNICPSAINRLKIRYCVELEQIKDAPDHNRIRAEIRFFLLKKFFDSFEPQERQRLGRKYRVKPAKQAFCKQYGISLRTFFRWQCEYNRFGIKGLVPGFGNRSESERETVKPGHIKTSIAIDPCRPLQCLRQLLAVIKVSPAIPPDQVNQAIEYLDRELSLLKRKTGLSLPRALTVEERQALLTYRAETHKNHRAKALALLMVEENRTMAEIAKATARAPRTIYRWLRLFKAEGLAFIETKMDPTGREKQLTERSVHVVEILRGPPSIHGINRTTWTLDNIRKVYGQLYGEPLSTHALRQVLKKIKYSWRHAKKVLTSPDPNYQEKVRVFLDALHNLNEGDAFFFIDEAGPWQVKKYGGKALMPPGVTRVIPQVQKSKDTVYLICALEALTNQVVWRFIGGKTTKAVVDLLEMIRKEYRDCSKIWLTWDALATHRSKTVVSWLDDANSKECPKFEVCPLPTSTQSLNVVESTFSNTRKAVIHNSDYASAEEMKEAIARYLEERNAYFKENPKRAGNKIWDKEIFKIEELPGGLFRRM